MRLVVYSHAVIWYFIVIEILRCHALISPFLYVLVISAIRFSVNSMYIRKRNLAYSFVCHAIYYIIGKNVRYNIIGIFCSNVLDYCRTIYVLTILNILCMLFERSCYVISAVLVVSANIKLRYWLDSTFCKPLVKNINTCVFIKSYIFAELFNRFFGMRSAACPPEKCLRCVPEAPWELWLTPVNHIADYSQRYGRLQSTISLTAVGHQSGAASGVVKAGLRHASGGFRLC